MIDWTKPIETVGGRLATLLTRSFWRNGATYCVVQVEDSSTSDSEVFIINPTTARCIKSGMQIRNVKVKREGWIKLRCIEWCVMAETKEAIEATISPNERNEGWKAVYAKWEE